MYIFTQYPYHLIFNQYFILKVITFEGLQNFRFMTVDIILNEINFIVTITTIIYAHYKTF